MTPQELDERIRAFKGSDVVLAAVSALNGTLHRRLSALFTEVGSGAFVLAARASYCWWRSLYVSYPDKTHQSCEPKGGLGVSTLSGSTRWLR